MATITTDTFLDSGTARTAGEAWTINGATLTIRTDTRWHIGAPASMTGSLGAITNSGTIGKLKIDGTKVRWMPFNTGSGTVPAIGTSITQGGVTGYLLGVWTSLTSTPTAVGAAMPAIGFLKFREVSGGAYAAGALTGISCSAASPDVTGWIEIVMDQNAKLTLSSKGNGFETDGNWFYLDNTNGTRLQNIQCPSTGGTSNSFFGAAQIETAPGSNVFEWWSAVDSTNYGASFLNTSVNGKVLKGAGAGTLTIGGTAGAAHGYLPPSGCRVRIPNVILRQCTTAARATNASTTTSSVRPSWNTGTYGDISIAFVSADWNIGYTALGNFSISNSAIEGTLSCTHITGTFSASNIGIGNPSNISGSAFSLTGCVSATISDMVTGRRVGSSGFSLIRCENVDVSNVKCFWIQTASNTSLLSVSNSKNVTLTNITTVGGSINAQYCDTLLIQNHDYSINSASSVSTVSSFLFGLTGSTNVTYDGATIGANGTIPNSHPYSSFINTSGNKSKIKILNIGSATAPINTGSNATYQTRVLWETNGGANDNGIQLSRIFATKFFTTAINTYVAITGLAYQNFNNIGSYSTPFSVLGFENSSIKGTRASTFGDIWTDSAGTHFGDYFVSSTAGGARMNFAMATTASLADFVVSIDGSVPIAGFDNTGIKLITAGDSVIYTTNYYAKGHTAFQNVDPTFSVSTNVANHTVEYDIDTGTGFSGTWKTLNGANLSAETLNPAIGFKLKVKLVCVTPDATNKIGNIKILTDSTSSAQSDNLYPLSTATLGFTNLVAGSEVRVYAGSDPATATEIGGTESTGTTYSFTHSSGGTAGVIVIFAMGYQPFYLPYTFKSVDDSILVQQVIDRNYVNPA